MLKLFQNILFSQMSCENSESCQVCCAVLSLLRIKTGKFRSARLFYTINGCLSRIFSQCSLQIRTLKKSAYLNTHSVQVGPAQGRHLAIGPLPTCQLHQSAPTPETKRWSRKDQTDHWVYWQSHVTVAACVPHAKLCKTDQSFLTAVLAANWLHSDTANVSICACR